MTHDSSTLFSLRPCRSMASLVMQMVKSSMVYPGLNKIDSNSGNNFWAFTSLTQSTPRRIVLTASHAPSLSSCSGAWNASPVHAPDHGSKSQLIPAPLHLVRFNCVLEEHTLEIALHVRGPFLVIGTGPHQVSSRLVERPLHHLLILVALLTHVGDTRVHASFFTETMD